MEKYWAFIYLLRTRADDKKPVPWEQIVKELVTAHKLGEDEAREIVARYRKGNENA